MQISLLNCVMNFHDVSLLGEWIDAQNCSSIFSSQWSSTKLWKLASRLTKSSLGFPSEVMVWSGRHGSRRKHWSSSCQRHPWIWWIWLDWYGLIMISAFLIFGDVNSPFSMCFWYSQVLLHCKKISTNVVKRPMPIPKPRPWDILQQDKQIKQGVAPCCIFWNILARDLPTVFQSMGQGSELSSISAAKATVLGQILGATLWWEICKQNEPMHDMEITWNKLI